MRNPRIGARHLLAAGLLLLTGVSARAQQWWNPDYSKRVPVTITNDQDIATPNPTTAEITLAPIPAELRGDWTDIRVVYTNGSVVKDLDRQVLLDEAPTGTPPAGGAIRVVFRLVDPIPAFGTSNNYTLYYGALSPTRPSDDVYKIYDHIVDFLSPDNVLNEAPPAWESLPIPDRISDPMYEIQVKEFNGVKQGYFLPKYHHPQAFVKEGMMPTFLNAEFYARVTPATQASGEIQLLGRVPASPTNGYPNESRAQGGGYAFAMDGWGEQNAIAHWTGLDSTKSPPWPDLTLMASTGEKKYYHKVNATENMFLRITDTLSGKTWKDGDAQRPLDLKDVALTAGNPNPVYDKPGTVGFATYEQPIYVQFVAAREIRTITNNGAVEDAPTGQARIAGTVRSTKTGPLGNAAVTISDGTNTWVVYSAADGRYQLSVPAGSYTVSASKEYHVPVNITNVTPTVAGVTDVTLNYIGVKVSGSTISKWFRTPLANSRIIAADGAGNYVAETTTDAKGAYTLMLPQGGAYSIGMIGRRTDTASSITGVGDRKKINPTSAQDVTVNLEADVPANGDMELPDDASETRPAGWGNDFDAPGAYIYTRDKNHTPDGVWSIGITDPANTSAWSPPNKYNLPVMSNAFDVEVSAWVYFTKPGQYATLRMRNNWIAGGDTPRIAAVAGRVPGTPGYNSAADTTINANTPAFELNNLNTGGLDNEGKVPVGQWYQLVTRRPAGDGLVNNELGLNLYGQKTFVTNPDGTVTTTPVGGTMYFDDLKITIVPKNVIIAKVVDKNGNPAIGAYAGVFTDGGVAGAPKNLLQDFIGLDANGEMRRYYGTPTTISIGAVAHIGGDPNNLPDWGYLVDRKDATSQPYSPNMAPTVTLDATQKATNAPGEGMEVEEYTFHMVGTTPTRVERSARPTLDAFDNRFTTWSGNGGNQSLGIDAANPTGTAKPRWNVMDINLWDNVAIDQIEFSYETAPPQAMKIWISDQSLDSTSWPMVNPPDTDLVLNSTGFGDRGLDGYMDIQPYIDAGYAWLGGRYHWIRLAQPKTGQYIRIWFDSHWPDGHTGFREIRILSKAIPIPPPYVMDDVVRVLKIAGGLEFGATTDLDAFDAVDDDVIDVKDAMSMAHQVATW